MPRSTHPSTPTTLLSSRPTIGTKSVTTTLDPEPLDPTTEVPVIDASAPADGFEAMTPVSMLERDDTRKGARRAIDPLLVRIGAVAVVTTLLVPLMIGLTSGGDGDGDTVASGSTIPAPTLVGPAAEAPIVPDETTTLDPDLLPPAVPVNPPTSADDRGVVDLLRGGIQHLDDRRRR